MVPTDNTYWCCRTMDAVIAVTANIPDMQAELNLIWKYLLPALANVLFCKRLRKSEGYRNFFPAWL